ncbi:uncharacterized protein KY384_003128 [Bacidia gigantensis]|uniref:uncharacterized protein n=1 Tax=Bacidia gigantensis TaxID=2732470 RepID=UPI001D03DA36|nr:uncharacterized protein KY384_003128 [Bacidia gigantensis]KAG8531499.1 hypothetical protein KY384_003128 [Bacidia gigantensis]
MDVQPNAATKSDLEYFQTQMKNVYATQAEHADRLMRLEQRQEGDSRYKSAWGTQSPFSGLLNGNSQHDTTYNPAAEAFKSFDQDQPSNMMGSLHLDTDDEPRRGASRANSVRFDESAIHGHFTQGSRTANEFFPSRSGSAFGSHPLTERSTSHKSEGRQSSTHSARASSIGVESRPLSATVAPFTPSSALTGPPPGLFILGPVPSIIRCWLDTNFSNDSLMYAAVCTGSYRSTIHTRLLYQLDLQDRVTTNREKQKAIKLAVYLPEATVQQSSSRSASPAPQLPTITTDFIVQESPVDRDAIDILLGCDVLRFRNADIHFSLDRLTLFDDERNKVSVPLVRPENASIFRDLQTSTHSAARESERVLTNKSINFLAEQTSKQPHSTEKQDAESEVPILVSPIRKPSTPPPSSPSVIGEGRKTLTERSNTSNGFGARNASEHIKDNKSLTNGATPDTPVRTESSNIWTSWRRDSTHGDRPEPAPPSASSASGYQKAGRGRGMKVLKPARLNTSRTPSSPQPVGFDAAPSRWGESNKSGAPRKEDPSPATASDRRSFSSEPKPPLSSKLSSSNPVGGASAFGWLNPGQKDQKE